MGSETFRLAFRQGTGIGATKNPHRRTIIPEPDLTVLSDREDLLERALFEGPLVFLRVFAAEFAPVVAVDPIDRRLSLALKGSSGVPSKHGEKQRQETQGEDQQGQTYGEGKKGKKAQEEGEVGPPASQYR